MFDANSQRYIKGFKLEAVGQLEEGVKPAAVLARALDLTSFTNRTEVTDEFVKQPLEGEIGSWLTLEPME